MAKHMVVALQLIETRKGMELRALTQSPRGTKTILRSKKLKLPKGDRKLRESNIEKAIAEVLAKEK